MQTKLQSASAATQITDNFSLSGNLAKATAMGILVFAILASLLLVHKEYFFSSEKSTNVFVYLASSFLDGKLDIDPGFPNHRDLSIFQGKIYAMWPPLCAFLLMPFVKLNGLNIGDHWISIFLAALSTTIGWLTIDKIGEEQGWAISSQYKTIFSIFIAFGTSFLILSTQDSHWYMAQVAAAAMMILSIYFLMQPDKKLLHYSLAGIFWSLAICSRLHLVLAAPIFIYVAFFGMTSSPKITSIFENTSEKFLRLICLFTPVILIVVFNGWYNWARFGSVWQTGVAHHKMWDKYAKGYKHFGYIHPHYFLYNAYYTLLRIPLFEHQSIFKEPSSANWVEGYSLFFQSPPLLYVLLTLKNIKKDWLITALWLSIILVSIPILFLMGTGTMQFGARYLFDLFPLFLSLVVLGSKGKATSLFVALTAASVAINIWGLHLFSYL